MLLSAFLGLIAAVCFLADNVDSRVMFRVTNESGSEQIALYNAGEGNHILFLPSYSELEQVSLSSDLKNGIVIGSTAMTEGSSCAEFALDEPYALTIDGKEAGTIRFCRSANVATMYIDTISGSMDQIHGNKAHRESASMTLYTAEGVRSTDDANCTVHGRGNSTWNFEKKPYLLKLSSNQSLLGMQAATDWILLANAIDVTNLRNKLVYDFAHCIGFEPTPDCHYVDVFLNGEYNGLYLLSEKIDNEEKWLNLDLSIDDFLCKVEIKSRLESLDHPFETQSGRTIEYVLPKMRSNAEYDSVVSLVNDMEKLIFSDTDLHAVPNFDIDSWAYHYLLDEVFANIDADTASSYFYHLQGVFYSGPIWDYDLTFGMQIGSMDPSNNAQTFCANTISPVDMTTNTYYNALYENPSFYTYMVHIYQTEFLPRLEEMINHGIAELATDIEKASLANRLRWAGMYSSISASTADPYSLAKYLEARIAFLNSVWLEGEPYCILRMEYPQDGSCREEYVRKGSFWDKGNVSSQEVLCVQKDTGEIFDFNQPIMKDTILVIQNLSQGTDTALATRDYITIASIGALMFLLLCFGLVDLLRRSMERRGANAGTHVPS